MDTDGYFTIIHMDTVEERQSLMTFSLFKPHEPPRVCAKVVSILPRRQSLWQSPILIDS